METRIYVVSNTKNPKPARLVEATSQSQALRHVAQDEYFVEVASAKDVAHLITGGCAIESAQTPKANEAEAVDPVAMNG